MHSLLFLCELCCLLWCEYISGGCQPWYPLLRAGRVTGPWSRIASLFFKKKKKLFFLLIFREAEKSKKKTKTTYVKTKLERAAESGKLRL
jgi:hypothetical protein